MVDMSDTIIHETWTIDGIELVEGSLFRRVGQRTGIYRFRHAVERDGEVWLDCDGRRMPKRPWASYAIRPEDVSKILQGNEFTRMKFQLHLDQG